MPDESFLRNREKQVALNQLTKRLQQEQLAFDPGDPQHDDYQAQLDAIQAKNDALAAARLLVRQQLKVKP